MFEKYLQKSNLNEKVYFEKKKKKKKKKNANKHNYIFESLINKIQKYL